VVGKRKRIIYGSLDWPDKRHARVWRQNEFLKTIESLEPKKEKKPLGDLAKQPLDQYVRFVEKQDRKSIARRRKVSARWKEPNRHPGLSFFSLLDEDDPLRVSIQEWGETYHLNSSWCYDVALLTLQNWYQFKETTGKRFESLPFYGNPSFLGFGSLLLAQQLASMPRDSLNEDQKKIADSFSEEDKRFVNHFSEQQRAYLSYHPYDPHITDDEFFLEEVSNRIEMGLPPVNTALPVLNLLSISDRKELQVTLLKRAKELRDRIKEYAKSIGSVRPQEVGTEEVSKHIEWAVRYQVFEEDYYSIERKKHPHPEDKRKASVNVRKEVLKFLGLINLRPKPTTRGRRRLL
jgi:hypothetical protein